MSTDRTYDTETMAELCVRQGRLGEAIAIYRTLADTAADDAGRARARGRLRTLEASRQPLGDAEVPAADVPLPEAPGVAVHVGDDQITVAWSLPPETTAPAVELLVIARTPSGIETVKKTIPLAAASGRLGLAAAGLHSALAAAGSVALGRFVPLVRSRR